MVTFCLPVGTLLFTGLVCWGAAMLHPLLGLAVQMFWCGQALAAKGLVQESTCLLYTSFLYLGQSLTDAEGQSWPMAGVLPGEAKDAGRLVRFGYAALSADSDSMLFRAGESLSLIHI